MTNQPEQKAMRQLISSVAPSENVSDNGSFNSRREASDRSRSNSLGRSFGKSSHLNTKQLMNAVGQGSSRKQNSSRLRNTINSRSQRPADIYLDPNDADLKGFYWLISTKTKLDPAKLYNMVKNHFEDQTDNVFPIIKKAFGNFKVGIAFKEFCIHLTRFISLDFRSCKELFFGYLDLDKDKRVCETDLFKVLKSLTSFKMSDLVVGDLISVLKKVNTLRLT